MFSEMFIAILLSLIVFTFILAVGVIGLVFFDKPISKLVKKIEGDDEGANKK